MTRFLAGLGVHGTAGLSFSPTLGASVWFGVRHAWLGLRLLGRADLPTSLDVTGGSVVINVLAASLVPCVHILDALGVCAVGTVGGLQVNGRLDHRNRVVMFGGFKRQYTRAEDTWEWDGRSWTRRVPPASPPARGYHAMAYDSARQQTVLFSGEAVGADTWLWNGTTWVAATPVGPTPEAREGHVMAYDAQRQRVVLFGGYIHPTPVAPYRIANDTWEWDGTSWARRTPANSPPARRAVVMVYDPVRSRTVLFGGEDDTRRSLADSWEWDGTNWTHKHGTGPSRTNATGVYDPLRQRVLAIGGQFVTITPYQVVARSDTWEWDGTTWSLRPVVLPLIGERDGTAAAFDAASGLTVLFGGRAHGYHSDTWLLR